MKLKIKKNILYSQPQFLRPAAGIALYTPDAGPNSSPFFPSRTTLKRPPAPAASCSFSAFPAQAGTIRTTFAPM